MKSKTICFCIPGRKQKEGKKGSSKSHRSSKRRDLHLAGPGDHVEATSYDGATTSTDAAGVAAVMMSTAATEAAIHGTDVDSAHGGGGGDGGSSHGGGCDGGG
ncbi:hypothetical protein PanWU01x14_221330 [Parasponia andersonii]|uniref:Uncharacterized protein n=1 Tax=Parasponia andersonii TaxID=3476 RepID=A0A2P5BPM5_PARAD|nr:hypothetical protein PanWU01x14_221330 [Parasponia andersonii]